MKTKFLFAIAVMLLSTSFSFACGPYGKTGPMTINKKTRAGAFVYNVFHRSRYSKAVCVKDENV